MTGDDLVASGGPRITPGDRRSNGLANHAFAVLSGRVTGTQPPNLFTTLGRTRGLFRGWLHFAGKLMPGGRLPRRETELVILRVAHVSGCAYEWAHHQHLARRAKVTAAEIDRVTEGPQAVGWTPRERSLLEVADAVVQDGDASDETWAAMRSHLDEREAIELVLLAAHYKMLASTITTLRLDVDLPRRG